MKTNIKILLTGAQGDIAQSIFRILKKKYPNSSIEGMDCVKEGAGEYIYDKFFKTYKVNNSNYLKYFKSYANKYDLILPTSESEINYFANNPKILKDYPILINKPHIIKLFLDKFKTFNYLKENDLNPPSFCISLDKIKKYEFSFFLKTKKGSGNKRYKLINSKKKFEELKNLNKKNWIAQEYLGLETSEYTCALIKLDNYVNSIILKRKLLNGMTYYAEVTKNKNINKILNTLASTINLEGCINIQLKIKKNKISIFEINPRLSSTVMMRHKVGFQDCLWWVDFFLKKKLPQKTKIIQGKILRIYDEKIL